MFYEFSNAHGTQIITGNSLEMAVSRLVGEQHMFRLSITHTDPRLSKLVGNKRISNETGEEIR